MYSLVVLLSILASASFALAFVRGERKHVVYLGVWLALLLYTHTWGVFLVVAMSAVWLHLRRRGEVDTGDGVRLLIVLAVAYLPWLLRLRDLLGVSLDEHAALEDWLGRVEERPSVAAEVGVVAAL